MLIENIRNNAEGSDQSIDILMIAKYLEKIGDHANNIAEWVAFSINRRTQGIIHVRPLLHSCKKHRYGAFCFYAVFDGL